MAIPVLSVEEGAAALVASLKSLQQTRRGVVGVKKETHLRGGHRLLPYLAPRYPWLPYLPSPPLSAQGAKGPGSDASTIVSVDRRSRTSPRVLSDADPAKMRQRGGAVFSSVGSAKSGCGDIEQAMPPLASPPPWAGREAKEDRVAKGGQGVIGARDVSDLDGVTPNSSGNLIADHMGAWQGIEAAPRLPRSLSPLLNSTAHGLRCRHVWRWQTARASKPASSRVDRISASTSLALGLRAHQSKRLQSHPLLEFAGGGDPQVSFQR